ncbi:LamB/YcsF family protein [Bacillus sp. Marseille-Q3570]|uniref:LamB/YcsF family protein n=1 Tax=Bacillus sp. Marseille-Q3570 TaxID=2963522 RepID=UPI0021B74229|nr:5-oxoprolinase subunit PxpA [Bacillus sp. Marseille-Q3570]
MNTVDLNCDLGESFGTYEKGSDEAILDYVTSANIACGFHAGDPSVMRKTVKMAMEKNVAIGAHPGLQDLVGFGRREMQISPEEAYDLVTYQIGALYGFVQSEGGVMQHVKPHGALYNMAAKDPELAEAIAEAVYDVDPELILFGLSGSELIKAGKKTGTRTASEVFSDRTYQEDGTLTSRKLVNALIEEEEKSLQQVVRMVKEGKVMCLQGIDIPIEADTICIHGDGASALSFARNIRTGLKEAGITIEKVGMTNK